MNDELADISFFFLKKFYGSKKIEMVLFLRLMQLLLDSRGKIETVDDANLILARLYEIFQSMVQ